MAKRREKGTGSVYERKGRFVGEYTDVNGKRRYVSGKSKADVKAKLKTKLKEKDEGVAYDAANLTFGAYLDQWLATTKGTVRDRTWERSEQIVRVHLKPALGNVKLARLNTLQLQDLYTKTLKAGRAPRTVICIHANTHKALKQAVGWSLIPRNVAESAIPPKPNKEEVTPLTQDQSKALLEAAKGDKHYALYVLALTTGMRQGEILGLQWKDVDLNAGTLRVSRSVRNGAISPPKTQSGRRTITMTRLGISALKAHRREAAKQRISEWVFSTSKGTPVSCHNLHNRSWKPLLLKAQLPHSTRFHDLRHTCATLLLGKGVHPKYVQALLGHATIAMTLDLYSHWSPGMGAVAAEAMDDTLDDQAQDSL